MIASGAQKLQENMEYVNGLNVFPVPDGDTGTNMNLTFASGLEELSSKKSLHIGQAAETLAKGLLLGARGNSGVILSQLFRGFAKAVHDFEEINAPQFAVALQQGVEMAYKAVIKPVEGTILTVAKEAAKGALTSSRRVDNIEQVMQDTLLQGSQALARTPELLPILKKVGVVDAGGQGLIYIYEGFMEVLLGVKADFNSPIIAPMPIKSAQAHLATDSIEHGYCTEFLVKLDPKQPQKTLFQESLFRQDLAQFGDSLLVVADDELVKVHIHAEYPGQVMDYAMKYGELIKIKIENMREQHSHILMSEFNEVQVSAVLKEYGIVAIGAGEGISAIFSSLGADIVLAGGQTMNPSTEDIVQAIQQIAAKTIYVLPNNSNIILAAQQAKELLEGQQIIVIPTKTIPQGMAAMIAFNYDKPQLANTDGMLAALNHVQSGQITYAVRDTEMDQISIKKADFLGMLDNQIIIANADLLITCQELITRMLMNQGEILTILTGQDALEDVTHALQAFIKANYPEVDIEVHSGGQPVYSYIISVE
ncbi:DAK2 domain-containing protein [Paenibacillus psychroresistens]|nr:DAK2 domain-containing protein [Paenibacillus psychroresistens]